MAWLTIDSSVPPARGFSQYLQGWEFVVVVVVEVVVLVKGLFGTRGGPKPCMAICPFSHVSSATS